VIAPDSSVVVAALGPWHPAHEASRTALLDDDRRLIGHVAFEAVSVLSRMPYRVTPTIVLQALDRDYPLPWLALDADSQQACLHRAVDGGLRGGALYDALIAATAVKHGVTLISADRRAQPTYEAMGVQAQFIDPE
jgi:predicted nucleic acid-binding protein